VRSGQQLYAEKQSLVIFGSVNEGGEVLADGDIFVFGRLCGRVVAGLGSPQGTNESGEDITHQIFATSFQPSLVGIGSVFVIPDDYEECTRLRNKPINVSLQCEDDDEMRSRRVEVSSNIVRISCEGEGATTTMLFRQISL
jgi:septum site-determining protein MinC